MPDISIDAIALASPAATAAAVPDAMESLWQAWLSGNRRQVPLFPNYADLHSATLHSVKHLLHGPSIAELAQTGLILATTKADIHAQIQWMRATDSSSPPLSTTPPNLNHLATAIASHLQLRGPTHTISTACSSGLTAIIDAACLLLDGDAQHMLALGFDYAGPGGASDPHGFIHDGFQSLKAISPTACRPFDRNRDGLSLGSAAAGCSLSLGRTPGTRAILSGWGVASDAVHMTAPDRTARGLIQAMQNALDLAQLKPHDIDVLFAHGTGTRYNDAMESVAINAIFRVEKPSSPRPKGPAITAIKGLIGHTLGASGLIETAMAVRMLETQIIPPITGLLEPDFPDLDLVTSPRPAPIKHIMKVASGFGGLNAAIILSHPDTESRR